jgi:hypothetical protein
MEVWSEYIMDRATITERILSFVLITKAGLTEAHTRTAGA